MNCNKQEILESLYAVHEKSDWVREYFSFGHRVFCYIGLAVASIFDTFCAVKNGLVFIPISYEGV